MILSLVLLVVFLAVAASMWFHGLWNNLISLINVVLAAIIATSFFENVAKAALDQVPKMTYLIDFLLLWILFGVSYGLLRLATDFISSKRVVFQKQVELAGRGITAALIGFVFMAFTAMTLHTAPLQASPFNGAWASPADGALFGMHVDRNWLGLMQTVSAGSLAGDAPFDPNNQFPAKYYQRRKNFEAGNGLLR